MNGKNLVPSSSNEFGSQLLYNDDTNGNEEDRFRMFVKCEHKLNSNDAALAVTRSEYDVDNDSIPQDHTELDSTVDYTKKSPENGLPDVMSALHVHQMQFEDTVDYINKESLQIIPTKTCVFSPDKSTTNPSTPKCMHNKQDVIQSVPYIQKSSGTYHNKTDLMGTSLFAVKQTDEACGNVVSEQVEVGAPFTMNKDIDVPTLSLFSLSMDMSEMCMRKNSLVSSSSEKPMSTSFLESSSLPNTSIEVFSGSIKWTNKVPGGGDSGESFGEELHYFEVPPHNKDSKEHDQNCEDPEFTNQVADMNVMTCHVIEGCRNERLLNPPDNFSPSNKMKDDINKNNMCPLPGTEQDANLPVLHIEEINLVTEKVNGAYVDKQCKFSSRTQSLSVDSTDLNNSSGHNGDDTFLVGSPNLQTDTKAYTSTPLPESKNMTFCVPVLDDIGIIEKHTKSDSIKDVNNLNTLGSGTGNATTKQIYRKPPPAISVAKAKKTEVVNFPKPNFKNVKAKVLTRAALLTKDCPSYASKPSPHSPQSQSNASSPLASPRAPASAIKTAHKKSVLEQDLKAVAAIAKFQKQPINKQLFPSQPAHAPTHSKYAQGKVPRTAVLKQSQDEIERASSTNSTRSSGSATALPCTAIPKLKENRVDKAKILSKPAAVNGIHMGPDKILQNGHGVTSYEKSKSQKEDCTSGDIISNVANFSSKSPTPNKNLHKELLSCLRNATSQPVSTAKARLQSSEQRRSSLSKNVVTVKVTSPPRINQQSHLVGDLKSPNRKSNTVKGSTLIGTRSLPRTRIPCKGPTLQRTPSVSSVCSTHSDKSTVSTRCTTDTAATSSTKADEGLGLCSRNGITGSSKGTFTRTRSQSLKVAQTSTKKSPILNQGLPKSGPSIRLTKRVEPKVVNGVDSGKQKKSPKGPVTQTKTPPVDTQALELVQYKTVCEEQKGVIQKLKHHLSCSNQRFEALTVVVQHVINQREETLRKRKELSQELLNLRGDLVSASSTCDKLEKEKNDLLVAYEGIIQKVKDEHLAELADLEEKLKQFYTRECEKLQTIFIAEAEKYKNELQEKVDDLNTTHEVYRLAAETSHIESIEAVKEEYDKSLSELRTIQEVENKAVLDSIKEKQADLERKIEELTQENESLKEKLKAEEQRKQSKEKLVQKSPHVMYLEQELESLKAVLEIKNEKLHQQDKKLMQVEKLVETNTTLVERLNKCQQENEDLKARMANHIALSRQLSTEQEVLQRSLEKESKVNKRLSMENEELLWKLHNGDLCSPKKLSPSSPGIPFHPSRNSGSFSSPTVSPR